MNEQQLVLNALASDKFWAVNKVLARFIGIEEATMTAELLYKFQYWKQRGGLDDRGGFFCTSPDLQSVMGMGDKAVGRLTSSLVSQGIFSIKKRGVPAKNYWYPNFERLREILETPDSGMTSDPQMGVTGDPLSGVTGDPQKGVAITNNEYQKRKTKKIAGDSPAEPSLSRRVTDLIGEAHKHMTGEELAWIGKGKQYGQAVQKILEIVSRETIDPEQQYLKIREKCAAYVQAARTDDFLKKQGVTPLSVLSNWNKVHYKAKAGQNSLAAKKFPDYRAMSPQQIREAFKKWNKDFTVLDLQKHISKHSYEKFINEAKGFAPALVDILIQEVSAKQTA